MASTLRPSKVFNKPSINLIQQKQKRILGKFLRSSLASTQNAAKNKIIHKISKRGNEVIANFIGHEFKFTANKSKPFYKKQSRMQPLKKVSQCMTSKNENNISRNSLSNHQSSAFSPQYMFDSPSTSPCRNTSTKSVKRNTVQDLTCPTCDKTFPAKSIFERHIKTYKHGRYEIYEQATPPPSYIPSSKDDPQLPHLNPVLQPTIEVGGREVNKYECHLCNQVFLRVRDLAKHRERMMCTAWLKK